MKHLLSACLLASIAFTSVSLAAGDDVEMNSADLGAGIYMVTGRGGNLGVSMGEDGIFLIDDQYAPLTSKIRAAINSLAGEKVQVKFILNTHFHGDHTGGNENFGKGGTLIVAHDNVRARMTTDEFRKSFIERGGESLADALPVVTFNDQASFHINGETLRTKHYANAHTDGDSVVFFEGANVIHMGDLYFQLGYPFIDTRNGGSVTGLLSALDDIISRIDADTRVIPGHGKISTRDELVEYRDMIHTITQRVQEQVDSGKDLAAIKAAGLTRDYDARWNWQFINGERFIESICADLCD
jgi:glyoxylase-like metal-dependent hydrolase (beta-lactamase superfamily II)